MFHLNKYDASCFFHKKVGASDFYHASIQFVSTYLYVISHFNMLLFPFFVAIYYTMTKDDDPNCMLKSRFSAARLRDIVLGLKEPRRKLITDRGWGVLGLKVFPISV
jgi:hypothetical protein